MVAVDRIEAGIVDTFVVVVVVVVVENVVEDEEGERG